MKAPAIPSTAQALNDLEQCVGEELAAIEKLCSLAVRAADVRDQPLDADALVAMLVVVGGKAELLANDVRSMLDLVRRSAGLEARP